MVFTYQLSSSLQIILKIKFDKKRKKMEIRKGTIYIFLLYLTIFGDVILIGMPEWGRMDHEYDSGLKVARMQFGLWDVCCIPLNALLPNGEGTKVVDNSYCFYSLCITHY